MRRVKNSRAWQRHSSRIPLDTTRCQMGLMKFAQNVAFPWKVLFLFFFRMYISMPVWSQFSEEWLIREFISVCSPIFWQHVVKQNLSRSKQSSVETIKEIIFILWIRDVFKLFNQKFKNFERTWVLWFGWPKYSWWYGDYPVHESGKRIFSWVWSNKNNS